MSRADASTVRVRELDARLGGLRGNFRNRPATSSNPAATPGNGTGQSVSGVIGTHTEALTTRPAPVRWALASAGILCVGLAALGVVVPGLPTTVFLIIAAWCFARSCTWLEQKLIRNRFFAPFLPFLVPGVKMPLKAKVISLSMMWAAIAISSTLFIVNHIGHGWPAFGTIAMGAVGTWFIARR